MVDSARRRRGPSRAFWAIAGVVLIVGAVTALLVLFGDRHANLTSANPAADRTAGRGNPPAAPAPAQPPANQVPANGSTPGQALAGPAPSQPAARRAAPPRGAATDGAARPAGLRSPDNAPGAHRPSSRPGRPTDDAIERAHSPDGHDVSSREGGESKGRDDESDGDGDHRRQRISVDDSGLEDGWDGSLLSRLTIPLDLLGNLGHGW